MCALCLINVVLGAQNLLFFFLVTKDFNSCVLFAVLINVDALGYLIKARLI